MGVFKIMLSSPKEENLVCVINADSMRVDKNAVIFEDGHRCKGIFYIEKVIGVIFDDSNT